MGVKKSGAVSVDAEQPFIIVENGVYSAAQVQRLLGLKPSSLRTAKREQGLVACRRGPRDLYLGSDLLAWLRAGRRCRIVEDRVEEGA